MWLTWNMTYLSKNLHFFKCMFALFLCWFRLTDPCAEMALKLSGMFVKNCVEILFSDVFTSQRSINCKFTAVLLIPRFDDPEGALESEEFLPNTHGKKPTRFTDVSIFKYTVNLWFVEFNSCFVVTVGTFY